MTHFVGFLDARFCWRNFTWVLFVINWRRFFWHMRIPFKFTWHMNLLSAIFIFTVTDFLVSCSFILTDGFPDKTPNFDINEIWFKSIYRDPIIPNSLFQSIFMKYSIFYWNNQLWTRWNSLQIDISLVTSIVILLYYNVRLNLNFLDVDFYRSIF